MEVERTTHAVIWVAIQGPRLTICLISNTAPHCNALLLRLSLMEMPRADLYCIPACRLVSSCKQKAFSLTWITLGIKPLTSYFGTYSVIHLTKEMLLLMSIVIIKCLLLCSLDLSECYFEELPDGFSQLSSLTWLDLRWCRDLRKAPDCHPNLLAAGGLQLPRALLWIWAWIESLILKSWSPWIALASPAVFERSFSKCTLTWF